MQIARLPETRPLSDDATGLGYLLKERVADVDSFITDMRQVAEGGTALDPEVISAMLAGHRSDGSVEARTPSQREVLALIAITHIYRQLYSNPAPTTIDACSPSSFA